LLLAVAVGAPTAAIGAEAGSGYNQTPTTPKTPTTPTTPATPAPKSGTSPAKESTPPEKEVIPAKASSTPTTETSKTLPFTGFDIRWTVGIGLLLVGVGLSIMTSQRRQRRDTGG